MVARRRSLQSLLLFAAGQRSANSSRGSAFEWASGRPFSTTRSPAGRNRIYQSVRSPQDLDNLLLLSSSSNVPLITLFTASWCPSCKQVQPLIQRMIEKDGVGEDIGGVGFAEVEYDAPGNEELGMRYMIRSLPTLLAFSRGEAQLETKVVKVEEMTNEKKMQEWIETEAKRGGAGGAGGGAGILGSFFGKGS